MFLYTAILSLFIAWGVPSLMAKNISKFSAQVADAQKRGMNMVLTFDDGDRLLLQQPIRLHYQEDRTVLLKFMNNGKSYTRRIFDEKNKIKFIAKNGYKYAITDIKSFKESSDRKNCQLMGQWNTTVMSDVADCDKKKDKAEVRVCSGQGECVNDARFGTNQYNLRCFAVQGVCPDFYTCANDKAIGEFLNKVKNQSINDGAEKRSRTLEM